MHKSFLKVLFADADSARALPRPPAPLARRHPGPQADQANRRSSRRRSDGGVIATRFADHSPADRRPAPHRPSGMADIATIAASNCGTGSYTPRTGRPLATAPLSLASICLQRFGLCSRTIAIARVKASAVNLFHCRPPWPSGRNSSALAPSSSSAGDLDRASADRGASGP